MIKLFTIMHKRGDISQEQFHAHWRVIHAAHAVKLVPVMKRYVQNHKSARPYPGFDPPSDGCPEVWLESVAAAQQLGRMPAYLTGAFTDEPAFMRRRSVPVVVRETVVIEGPPLARDASPVKALFFLKRGTGFSQAGFVDFWKRRDVPLLAGGTNLLRWVKSPVVTEAYDGQEPLFDGVEELWWPDEAAQQKDAAVAMDRQVAQHVDRAATRAMFVDENRVVWDS